MSDLISVVARINAIPEEAALLDDLRQRAAHLRAGPQEGEEWSLYCWGDWSPERWADDLEGRIAEYERALAAGLPMRYYEDKRRAERTKAELHRRRWGRRLQRLVERPVTALVDLVNRLGGDMYFEDY